jgi:hypothetical protein
METLHFEQVAELQIQLWIRRNQGNWNYSSLKASEGINKISEVNFADEISIESKSKSVNENFRLHATNRHRNFKTMVLVILQKVRIF